MKSFRSGCPISSALDLIGDKWTLVILRSMVMGASSYSDLLSVPERISTNILAERLRRMEAAGLVERRTTRRGAARGVYALTRKGAALLPTIQQLARWGEEYIPDRWQAPDKFYAARAEQLAG